MAIEKPVLVWFRQDLRLGDNPALAAAVAMQAPVVPVYILDDVNAGDFRQGAASRWWLHHSLTALNQDLDDGLLCLEGDAEVLMLDTGGGHRCARCFLESLLRAVAHCPRHAHQVEIA